MKWRRCLNKKVADYTNGNHRVIIYSNGTKVKETLDPCADHFTYDFPESFDLKITDYCDVGCAFCSENSTTNGKHANLKDIHYLMRTCVPGTEIAIGGGNALAHPDIELFVSYLNSLGLIPSITINQKHLKPYFKILKNLGCYGIGVSLTDPTNKEDFKLIDMLGPNAVIHTIAGILKPSDYPCLKNRKVLILGYKDIRRGHTNLEKHSDEIKANIEQLKKDLPRLVKHCKTISFDCLGLEQIDPKTILNLSDEKFNELYQGHDYDMFDKDGNITVSTMFMDAVNMQVARSSTAPLDKRYTFNGADTIKELLAKSCEGYT